MREKKDKKKRGFEGVLITQVMGRTEFDATKAIIQEPRLINPLLHETPDTRLS